MTGLDDLERQVIASRIYTLTEVDENFGVSRDVLMAAGARGVTVLCVRVPVDCFVVGLDIRSTSVRDVAALHYKIAMKSAPSDSHPPLRLDESILAFVVPPNICEVVRLTGAYRAELFSQAIRITVHPLNPQPTIPEMVEPTCIPLTDANGRMLDQRGYCRFGVYKVGGAITFDPASGFAGPAEMSLSPDTLCIAGSDLIGFLDRISPSDKAGDSGRDAARAAGAAEATCVEPRLLQAGVVEPEFTRPAWSYQDDPAYPPAQQRSSASDVPERWEPTKENTKIVRELFRLIQKHWQPVGSTDLKGRSPRVRKALEAELKAYLSDADVQAPAETAKALASLIQPEATRNQPLNEPVDPPYVSREYRLLLKVDLRLAQLIEKGGHADSGQAEREALVRRLVTVDAAPYEPLADYKVKAVVHILCRK